MWALNLFPPPATNGYRGLTPPQFNRMETTMTKSRITAVALTALTLAGSLVATSGSAQAHSHWGNGVGIGIAAGALLGAAAVSNAYASPVYVTGPSCRLVTRYDRFGNARMIQVCNYY
jgi:heme A synthase